MVTTRAAPGRKNREQLALYLAALVVAVALGLFTAVNPPLGMAMFIGLVAVVGFSRSGTFAVCTFTFVLYLESLAEVAGSSALSPIKLAGGSLIIVALLAIVLRTRPGTVAITRPAWRGHPVILASLTAFLVFAIASAAWATDITQVQSLGNRLVTDALVFLAVGVFLVRREQFSALSMTVVAAGVVSIAAGEALGTNAGGRSIGLFTDPNDLAAALTPAIALGFGAVQVVQRRWQWALGWLGIGICLYGVLLTQSRGGLLSLGVVALTIIATSRGRERLRMFGAVLVMAAIGALFLTLSPQGQVLMERVTSNDSSGRTDLWRVALKQFADHPVRGVGLGNYPILSRRYLDSDVRHTELFVGQPRTTHNTALEILAELGLVGFVTFYGFLIGCLVVTWRGLRLARETGDAVLVSLGRGVLAAALAAVASGIFLSGQYQELLWVLLAAGLSFHALAARTLAAQQANAAQ